MNSASPIAPLRYLRSHGAAWQERLAATVVALAILAINLLAASPGAHQRVHADAQQADHACAITLAAAGYCDTSADLPTAEFLLQADVAPSSGAGLAHWKAPHFWLPPAQAPPPGLA